MAIGIESATTSLPIAPCVGSFMSPEVGLQRLLARFRRDLREHVLLRRKVHGAAVEEVVDFLDVVAGAVGGAQLVLLRVDAHAREDAVPGEDRVALADPLPAYVRRDALAAHPD